MSHVIEKEIERAVARVAPARPAPAAPTAVPARSRPVAVRFSPMLEDTPAAAKRSRRWLVGVSIAAHVVLFAILIFMPKREALIDEPALPIEIVLMSPAPAVPEMARPPQPAKPAPAPKAEPKPQPKPEPPPPVAEAPKPEPKPVVREAEPAPVAKAEPPKPKPEVKVGLLDEMPSGPAIAASKSSRSTIVASGFDGAAGSASSAPRPGRVLEAAFDTSAPAPKRSRAAAGSVQEIGFNAEEAAPKKREREKPAGALDTEVEILSKPKPVYTDEARALKIEGDVVLDVTFEASGRVVVLGVAQGLGHGLDEAAAEAARKIRFNPARRDGSAVDQTTKLRVVFRLA